MNHDFSKIVAARSFSQRLVGLIGRQDDPDLFLYIPRCSSVHTFFMSTSIDIVFLDEKSVILAIVPGAKPWRLFFGPRGTSAVLELPPDYARQAGLRVGDAVSVESAP